MKDGDDLLGRLGKHTNLGHAKRDAAFLRQVELALKSPGSATTKAAGKAFAKSPMADAAATYRFLDNDKAALSHLREARARTVLESVPAGAPLLVVHDMSPLDYSRHNSKADRRKIGNHRGMGYEYVCCLAVDPESAAVLGVVHDTLISAEGPDDRDLMDYDYEPLFHGFPKKEKKRLAENHRHQMAVHVNGTSALLSKWRVTDVGDREFDDLFILDRCRQEGRDFVIRSSANRNVQMPHYDWLPKSALTKKQAGHPLAPDHVYASLKDAVASAPLQFYKELPLDSNNRVVDPRNAKRFAKLYIGSFALRLYRFAMRNKKYFKPPRPVEANVVVIKELDPPAGKKALLWVLLTSHAVDTLEQMSYVGRSYELRWKIEDFFRLLKSGYRVLDSRLNNAKKTARLLIVLTLAAMAILNLRRLIGLGPGGTLGELDYQRIKAAMLEPENTAIGLNVRLFAFIAKNGGWLGRRRDPIGPKILMRGLLDFLATLDTSLRYKSLIEEALENPETIREIFCV
jgi:hypothetical protein